MRTDTDRHCPIATPSNSYIGKASSRTSDGLMYTFADIVSLVVYGCF